MPVFTRFSTVAGLRGSSGLARDGRGFAVKFYTEEGVYELVGNNIPVFFIQDAIKYPDFIHAVKPEPHNEIPQAASAHDAFWDFISITPEAMHMIMWEAKLFWNSQTEAEKAHIVKALRFELSHVQTESVRARIVLQLARIDHGLASRVAQGLGMAVPSGEGVTLNMGYGADANPADAQSAPAKAGTGHDSALSMSTDSKVNAGKAGIKTRQAAILATDGADVAGIAELIKTLLDSAQTAIVGTHLGTLKGQDGHELLVNRAFQSTASVLFDAVYVAAGAASVAALKQDADAVRFVNEAYRHCKPLVASAEGAELLQSRRLPRSGAQDIVHDEGVITSTDTNVANLAASFSAAIA